MITWHHYGAKGPTLGNLLVIPMVHQPLVVRRLGFVTETLLWFCLRNLEALLCKNGEISTTGLEPRSSSNAITAKMALFTIGGVGGDQNQWRRHHLWNPWGTSTTKGTLFNRLKRFELFFSCENLFLEEVNFELFGFGRAQVIIYSPARTATQQGSGKVGKWKINFLSTQKCVCYWIEHLMHA